MSFADIHFRRLLIEGSQNFTNRNVKFNVLNHSVFHLVATDSDQLQKVLDVFDDLDEHLYYAFLLMKGRNNETPLELAIKVGNHKAIEMILTKISTLGKFDLLPLVYKHLPALLKMKIFSLDVLLDACFIQTP